jgi:hypothetical protein
MFAEELGVIVGKLRDGTAAERQKYAARGGHIIWRILMPRTRNHVYFRVNDSAGEVEVARMECDLSDPVVVRLRDREDGDKKVPHCCETFSFLVEPWGIEPQTSRVRLLRR